MKARVMTPATGSMDMLQGVAVASRVAPAGPGWAGDAAVALHRDTMRKDAGIAMVQATVIEEGMAQATAAAEAAIVHRNRTSAACKPGHCLGRRHIRRGWAGWGEVAAEGSRRGAMRIPKAQGRTNNPARAAWRFTRPRIGWSAQMIVPVSEHAGWQPDDSVEACAGSQR